MKVNDNIYLWTGSTVSTWTITRVTAKCLFVEKQNSRSYNTQRLLKKEIGTDRAFRWYWSFDIQQVIDRALKRVDECFLDMKKLEEELQKARDIKGDKA